MALKKSLIEPVRIDGHLIGVSNVNVVDNDVAPMAACDDAPMTAGAAAPMTASCTALSLASSAGDANSSKMHARRFRFPPIGLRCGPGRLMHSLLLW